jgi:DNA-nicking Smr family endonuclease
MHLQLLVISTKFSHSLLVQRVHRGQLVLQVKMDLLALTDKMAKMELMEHLVLPVRKVLRVLQVLQLR